MSDMIQTHFCHTRFEIDVEATNREIPWHSHLPKDLWEYIFSNPLFALTAEDLRSCALTCRRLRDIVTSDAVCNILMPRAGISRVVNESWFRTYCLWQTSHNYFIALDVSGSMQMGRRQGRLVSAVDKVKEVAKHIFTKTRRVIEMIFFTDRARTFHVRNMQELDSAIENPGVGRGNTDLHSFIDDIFNFHMTQAEPRFDGETPLPRLRPQETHVYLFSDFELDFDERLRGGILQIKEDRQHLPLNLYCYNYGDNGQTKTFLSRLKKCHVEGGNFRVRIIGELEEINEQEDSEEGVTDSDTDSVDFPELF